MCYIDESEIENRLKVEPAVIVLDSELNIREDFLMKRHITNNLSVKLFNKSWFDEVDIPEGRQVVDTLTMLQMVGKCKRYVCTTEPLYYAYMALIVFRVQKLLRGEYLIQFMLMIFIYRI